VGISWQLVDGILEHHFGWVYWKDLLLEINSLRCVNVSSSFYTLTRPVQERAVARFVFYRRLKIKMKMKRNFIIEYN
jgi:hypothetical protein